MVSIVLWQDYGVYISKDSPKNQVNRICRDIKEGIYWGNWFTLLWRLRHPRVFHLQTAEPNKALRTRMKVGREGEMEWTGGCWLIFWSSML
jgi:hypothetical protein